MNTIRISKGTTRIVAHRGCSGLEKENTNTAFIAAGNRSYYGIETDVQNTLDGKYVCFHDDTTGRVAIDDLAITKSTYETLRAITLCDLDGTKGRTDLRIPTLKEYIRTCKRYEKTAVLELKVPFTKQQVAEIIAEIREEDYLAHVVFISFYPQDLTAMRELLPDQPGQFLCEDWKDEYIDFMKDNGLGLDIWEKLLTEDFIRRMHENGIEVNCWTVNDPARGEQLAAWGIDYITTNILE